MCLLLSGIMAAVGCSDHNAKSAGDDAKLPEMPPEPVTLHFAQAGSYFTDTDFKELLVDPVRKKYPHITVEMIKGTLPNHLASRTPLDFYATWNGDMPFYLDSDIYEDLTPLAQKHKFDLGRFDQKALDVVKQISGKGVLYALPYAENIGMFYYNKDLFDKFGVKYPGDGMIWEDAAELARKLSREDGGVKYSGLFVPGTALATQYGLNYIDAATKQPLVNSEGFRRVFELGRLIYSIPNNDYRTGDGAAHFLKERTLAMLAGNNLFLRLREEPDLNWDVAQRPFYKEHPNIYSWYNLHLVIPLKTSKYRDDQMRVMEVLFSDEVQSIMVRKTVRKSTLADPKYMELFGKDITEIQGKRIASIFKSRSGASHVLSSHWNAANTLVNAEFGKVVTGQKDTNTALRDLEEQIKQEIAKQAK